MRPYLDEIMRQVDLTTTRWTVSMYGDLDARRAIWTIPLRQTWSTIALLPILGAFTQADRRRDIRQLRGTGRPARLPPVHEG